MSNGAIADRYAPAIFELGAESGELSTLVEGLSAFAVTYSESDSLKAALADPLVPQANKNELVKDVASKLGVSELGIRSLLVMAKRGRLPAIVETVAVLTEMFDQKEGVIRAEVTTAREMPDSYYEALTQKLQASTARKIVLSKNVDSSLVAGAIARVGDAVIDASVRGRLAKFERDVLKALTAESA